jgi:histidyl-tRNA synthetase
VLCRAFFLKKNNMAETPGIPKGTRDFSPEILEKRNYIFDIIKSVFKKYGYKQLETPALENLSTLTGKYGDEGDKLLFKIINSGDFLKNVTDSQLIQRNIPVNLISEKGLRYDLTVPFARYVVQHQNDITFPFKRFQIQPVWRADRPQKGRYREFYQCDADIIGSRSLINEFEIVQMIDEVFSELNLSVTIKINNRKLLAGIAERMGYPEKLTDITVAIDKLDKIGYENVFAELKQSGIDEQSLKLLEPILNLNGRFEDQLQCLEKFIGETESGLIGIVEIEKLFSYLKRAQFKNKIELDLTLARGLNYYTGAIFEVVSDEFKIGSICGGGRYDDLTGIFGLKNVSGVGISFGADRIFDVLDNLNRFPEHSFSNVKLMFVNFGEQEELYCLPVLKLLRENNINSEIYPENDKMKKQMKYADSNKIPFVALAGENEMKEQKFTLKNMKNGEQNLVTVKELLLIMSELK